MNVWYFEFIQSFAVLAKRKKSECRISRDWHQNVFDKFNESPFCSWFLPIATSIVIRSLWGLKISMHFASRQRLHNAKIRPDINSLMQFSLVTLFMFCSEEVGRSLHAASWNSCTENMETLRAESELRNTWKSHFFSWSCYFFPSLFMVRRFHNFDLKYHALCGWFLILSVSLFYLFFYITAPRRQEWIEYFIHFLQI